MKNDKAVESHVQGKQLGCCRNVFIVLICAAGTLFLYLSSFSPNTSLYGSDRQRPMYENIFPHTMGRSISDSPKTMPVTPSLKITGTIAAAESKERKIVLMWTFNWMNKNIPWNGKPVVDYDCGQYQCSITKDRSYLNKSDVVVFNPRYTKGISLPETKEPWQRWMVTTHESPRNEKIPILFSGKANWTSTYNDQSDIIWKYGYAVPKGEYDKLPLWFPKTGSIGERYIAELDEKFNVQSGSYSEKVEFKSKHTLWIVSHCGVHIRENYVKELRKAGIPIDIFGQCGKPDPCRKQEECTKKLYASYKFYIAFENSQCNDYITEKVWRPLTYGAVPIVLGAPLHDYEKLLPPNSFIHTDNFTSPAKLAKYLKYLNANTEAYNKYHLWRRNYVTFSVTEHTWLWMCDVCKKLDNPPKPAYTELSNWWTAKEQCRIEYVV